MPHKQTQAEKKEKKPTTEQNPFNLADSLALPSHSEIPTYGGLGGGLKLSPKTTIR